MILSTRDTKSNRRPPRYLAVLAAVATATTVLGSQAALGAQDDNVVHSSARLTARCTNPTVRLSVEESRLSYTLPDNEDPSKLQTSSFATQMITGGGFQRFGPSFVNKLCKANSLAQAKRLAENQGEHLWKLAVDRAQRHTTVKGTLPYSDDRPLYWTRLQATAAIRQWTAPFDLFSGDRLAVITTFDKASRGMMNIKFPTGKDVNRIIMSGFDPYTLDGGSKGTATGASGNNVRHGNPSGAAALAADGLVTRGPRGTVNVIQAYVLPVNYTEFEQGYLEDTVGPFMKPGPQQVSASVTMSQAGDSVFDLEQWNARYHGTYPGNDNSLPCPILNGQPQLAINNNGCNTQVPNRWGGPSAFQPLDPPQWTDTTLPIAKMIRANTGKNIPRPPGDEWPDQSIAFGVVWHTNFTEFPDCNSNQTVTRNVPVPVVFPPPTPPTPPDRGSCSYSGGGGNYLSNESAYRNTLLRDRMGLRIPAGHIHTPYMQRFTGEYDVSDATFDAWRIAIVRQGLKLVQVVANSTA